MKSTKNIEYWQPNWIDMKTYWSCRESGPQNTEATIYLALPPPTTKRIQYAKIVFNSGLAMSLAIGVWDYKGTYPSYRELNREELDRLSLYAKTITVDEL